MDKYQKAKQDLIQVILSFQKLTPIQQQTLAEELFGAINVEMVCTMLHQYWG